MCIGCVVCGARGSAAVFTLGRFYFYLIKAKLSYATSELPKARSETRMAMDFFFQMEQQDQARERETE